MNRQQFHVVVAITALSGFLGGALSGLMFAPAPVAAQGADRPVAQEVRAERFVVVDRDGRDRAVLAVDEAEPSLTLLDEGGTGRAILGLVEGEPILVFSDDADKGSTARAVFAVVEGESLVLLADEAGNDRVVLGGKRALSMTTGATVELPASAMTVLSAAGDVVWQAP